MKIAIGNDHAAMEMRNRVIEELKKLGHEVIDCGTDNSNSVDYPDYAKKVAESVIDKKAERGILICGTGIGMSIAANRFPQIRCSLCTDTFSAEMARAHNDANVLSLRARKQDPEVNIDVLKIWLDTPFSNEERHIKRIKKLSEM